MPRDVQYAINVPFWRWLGLKERIAECRYWEPCGCESVESASSSGLPCRPGRAGCVSWCTASASITGLRRIINSNCSTRTTVYFEYSAIVTNKAVTGRTLWFFMCGRGNHEKVYGELKGGFAFDCVPIQRYEANRAWQVFSVIAFNLMRALQIGTAERRSMNRKRRTILPFQTIQTLRYRFINRAGLLVQPNDRQILDVGNNPVVRERFQAIESALAA